MEVSSRWLLCVAMVCHYHGHANLGCGTSCRVEGMGSEGGDFDLEADGVAVTAALDG